MDNVGGGALLLILFIALYLLPTFVALGRRSDKTAPVVVVNLFLGWTLVGWVVALAMAVWKNTSSNEKTA